MPKVTVQYGKTRLAVQCSILVIVLWIVSYLTLYADRHNDERYLGKAEYEKDRKSDEAMRVQVQMGLSWRMDATDKKLDDISRDIKSLLSRPAVRASAPQD